MYLLDGQPLSPDMPFTHDGVNYPANWISLSSPADKAAIGVTEVVEEPRPDDFYASVAADPVNHGQWIVTPYTPEEMKPRLEAYSREKRTQRGAAGVEHVIDGETVLLPTDERTREVFFSYRIIQERPAPPINTLHDIGTKVITMTEAELLAVEQKMEDRVQGCLLTQLDLQTSIDAGTTTTKEQIDQAYAAVP
jgi:hypothetical protein